MVLQIPKKVLYISSRGDVGAGGENYLLTLFRHIDRNRFQPVVILPNDGTLRDPLENLNIEVIIIDANHGWLKPDLLWYALAEGLQARVKAVVDIIIDKQIDLVHTNSNHRFEGALAARLAGIPHLYLAHIEYIPDMPLFQRLSFSQPTYARLMDELSDQIITVSKSVLETLSPHVAKNKTHVIHNGLDLNIFNTALTNKSTCLKEELNIPNHCILITAVGRIAPDKGFDYFVDAAKLVLERHKALVHFIIIGADENIDFSNSLRQKSIDYSITDNLHFLGFRNDIPDILAASDIFVLSSRKEGHPYVMLEAMASECAIVASNCAGVEETIEEGISGFIVPIGGIDAMAERLNTLIELPALRISLAASAKKRIETFFTADKTANELMHAYEKLLQQPQKPGGSIGIELFLQNCTEIGHLGKLNVEMHGRLKRVENLADIIQNNIIMKVLRYFLRRTKKKL